MAYLVKALLKQEVRPFTILVFVAILLGLMDRGTGFYFSLATAFSVMQIFATFGLVALGVGLSLLIREFDISVAGMVSLAGAIAVMTGVANPWLGLALGLAAGVTGGTLQGLIMTRLRLSSVGVTLGGLLTFQGITYVLTGNQSTSYPNMHVALLLNTPIFGLLSFRSAVTLGVFMIAAVIMGYTYIGRDVYATGNNRRASAIAGVNTDRVIIGVFAASGGLSALTGVLLSYGLAAASPEGLADMLAPAAAAAIMGGVSLIGGRGNPMGIAAGVLILCILRSGLNAVGVTPHVHDIVTGAILFAVAIIDAPDFIRRLTAWRLHWSERTIRASERSAQPYT